MIAESQNPLRLLLSSAFEGHTLTLIEYRGAPAFIAGEVGVALGYSKRNLVRNIAEKWSAEFRDGEHYHLLTGAELALVKELVSGSETSHAPSLLLLTEPGLYRVLMLTGKPVGVRMRDWLDSEVLPSVARTGGYGAPALPPPLDPRLLGQVVEEAVAQVLRRLGAVDPGAGEPPKGIPAAPVAEVAHARQLRLLSARMEGAGRLDTSRELDTMAGRILTGGELPEEEEVEAESPAARDLSKVRELRHTARALRAIGQHQEAKRLLFRASAMLAGDIPEENARPSACNDPWFDRIRSWLNLQVEPFTMSDALDAVGLAVKDQDVGKARRMGAVLRAHGFESKVGRVGLVVARRWVRP